MLAHGAQTSLAIMWRWLRSLLGQPSPESSEHDSSSEQDMPVRLRRMWHGFQNNEAQQDTMFNPPAAPVPRGWDIPDERDLRVEAQKERHAAIQCLLAHRGLPPELIQYICLDANEGLLCTVSRDDLVIYTDNANTVYLTTPPLSSSFVRDFVLQVTVDTWSHDQGWSSEPNRDWLGTYQGSYTWWELTLDRPIALRPEDSDDTTQPPTNEVHRIHVCHNIHASREFKHHTLTLHRDHPLLRDIQQGDRLSLWARTQYPGWTNIVRSAQIHVRFCWT